VPTLVKHRFGKIFADKGYVSQPLFQQMLETFGLQLITKLKARMKNRLSLFADKVLLRKRAIIETVLDQLKNTPALRAGACVSQVEHTRHRSMNNFVVNLICGLIAYCHQPIIASRHATALGARLTRTHVNKTSALTHRSSLSAAPPYSPELQPAERLWPLTKEGVANQCFTDLEALTTVQRQCCEPLQHSPQAIRNLTLFHGWPEQSNDRCLTELNIIAPIRFER
jgi:transposase